jgi:NADH:ubiquinone reductase (non-electrogenic)
LTHLPSLGSDFGWRRTLQAIGRLTIGTVIVAGAGFYYVAHQERTPGLQLPHDPTKKTLVVLGSGWGATSFLKKLDTTDYNVVSAFA